MNLEEKRKELLDSEKDNPTKIWWLSFCDPTKPEGSQFLGVIIVDAKGFAHAHLMINLLGINPGGEIAGFEMTEEVNAVIKPRHKNRLLTKEECENYFDVKEIGE